MLNIYDKSDIKTQEKIKKIMISHLLNIKELEVIKPNKYYEK
ncbi:hypothetical protein ACFLY2_03430 [Patescibacteria group bacterium]